MRYDARLGGGLAAVAAMGAMAASAGTMVQAGSGLITPSALLLPETDGKTRHGKGYRDRPAKKPNMNHVSRRTKRKHRRAA